LEVFAMGRKDRKTQNGKKTGAGVESLHETLVIRTQ
jgi:hypothetical protein